MVQKKPKKKKVEAVSFIAANKVQKIGIVLKKNKIDPLLTLDALWAMDEKILTKDKLEQLQPCLPEEDDLAGIQAQLQVQNGSTEGWGTVEMFMYEFRIVFKVTDRFKLWTYKLSFKEEYEYVLERLNNMKLALLMLTENVHFKYVLSVIVALGNYMNGGTSKGEAFGFDISFLKNLSGTKANDETKSSLLMYIYTTCKKLNPECLEWYDEFKNCVIGPARLKMDDLENDKDEVQKPYDDMLVQMLEFEKHFEAASPEEKEKDKFVEVMSKFSEYATALMTDLSDSWDDLQKLLLETNKKYSQKKDQDWQDLANHFIEFMQEWKKSADAVSKIEEAKRKEEKKKAQEEAKKAKRAKMKKTGAALAKSLTKRPKKDQVMNARKKKKAKQDRENAEKLLSNHLNVALKREKLLSRKARHASFISVAFPYICQHCGVRGESPPQFSESIVHKCFLTPEDRLDGTEAIKTSVWLPLNERDPHCKFTHSGPCLRMIKQEKGLMKHVDKNSLTDGKKKKKLKPRSTIGALTKNKGRSMTQYFSGTDSSADWMENLRQESQNINKKKKRKEIGCSWRNFKKTKKKKKKAKIQATQSQKYRFW